MKRLLQILWPWLRNKYVVTLVSFVVWILFINPNNLVDRVKMRGEIRQLERDRAYYREQIEQDSLRLHELTTNKENLEKYAREQFFMKKADEDVFQIVE
ncbi:MAG: septum formation initiator family protein [Bacteroidales bacterium]